MSMILGVFNHPEAVERVVKGLEVLTAGRVADLWLCTDTGDFHVADVDTLRETVRPSRTCLASSSCRPLSAGKERVNRFVADAELYHEPSLQGTEHEEGTGSVTELLSWFEPLTAPYAEVDAACTTSLTAAPWALDGAYAAAYWLRDGATPDGQLLIARDLLGLRPLCFAHAEGFAFASEKRALEAMGYAHAILLEPRLLLRYLIAEDRLRFVARAFFSPEPELREPEEKLKGELLDLLRASIVKRRPHDDTIGLLFSGGLDSSLLAYLSKSLGRKIICYTVAVADPSMKAAEDLQFAERIAAELDVPLKVKSLTLGDIERYLSLVVPLIDDTDGVKISVALPLYAACELAKADGIRTLFYGLGTEELFAGYERHKRVNAAELNNACRSGLLAMHERDLYRDAMIAKALGIALRAPFLAPEFVAYALRIPAACKLAGDESKVILRAIARDLGLETAARRRKRAVQYGANIVKAIEKLAKRNGYQYTRDYLRTFYPARNIKLGCLFSSGKDSTFALWLMLKAGYPVACLINLRSRNPDSYMFHTPAVDLAVLQAEAIGLPLVLRETAGEQEAELEDLRVALRAAKASYGIEGVITGALWSRYQKDRIERIAAEEHLKVFSPLWHCNQETELRLVVSTFEIIFTGIGAYGLDSSWLGRPIGTADVDRLVALSEKLARRRSEHPTTMVPGLNIAGEGGEFESLVLDGPLFKKRLVILESEVLEEDVTTARLLVKEARLVDKE
jgi:diphthine-ammonia ligase